MNKRLISKQSYALSAGQFLGPLNRLHCLLSLRLINFPMSRKLRVYLLAWRLHSAIINSNYMLNHMVRIYRIMQRGVIILGIIFEIENKNACASAVVKSCGKTITLYI